MPPALVERLPPMVQLPSAPSDSGNRRSTSEARCWATCSTTPASQVMVLEAVSSSRILSNRRIEMTTSPLCGVCPPTRPVLPPCGTSAILCTVASWQIAETSAVEPGRSTSGEHPWNRSRSSVRKGAISAASVTAYLLPTMPRNLAISSPESAGLAGFAIFIVDFPVIPVPSRRGAAGH